MSWIEIIGTIMALIGFFGVLIVFGIIFFKISLMAGIAYIFAAMSVVGRAILAFTE